MNIDEQVNAIHDTADNVVPALASAFTEVVAELKDTYIISQVLEDAVSSGSINAIMDAVHIDSFDNLLVGVGMGPNAYIFTDVYRNAYFDGAKVAIKNLPLELQKALSFNPLNARAVADIQNRGFNFVSDTISSTKQGLRVLLEDAQHQTLTIPQRAREIRQYIGLTDSQMQAVMNFRSQLVARKNLGFTPADERRLDAVEAAMVRRHMKEGHLTNKQINNMVSTYYERLLNKRAMDIARTESLNAVNGGQMELWQQGIDQGVFNDAKDRKFWVVTPDDKLRPTHKAIPAMNPDGVQIRSQFITPFGTVFGPGDANPNLINCRCCLVLGNYYNHNWYKV